jgi:polyketide cyclase/dehydrase/lipid transport protein
MAHAEASARVATDAATLWRDVGSFQSVGEWHPILERVEGEGEQPGAIRTAYSADGAQVERLREVDAELHWQRYSMEATPLPVDHYTGELQVVAEGRHTSALRWAADFDLTSGREEDTVALVQSFLDAGVSELARRYGRPA